MARQLTTVRLSVAARGELDRMSQHYGVNRSELIRLLLSVGMGHPHQVDEKVKLFKGAQT